LLTMSSVLFLAQKEKVLVTSPTQIHYGREVPGKIVGVTTLGIIQRKSERNFQRDLRRPNECAVQITAIRVEPQ